MRVWVKGLCVPLISGVSKHESLISSSHIFLFFLLMHCSSNVSILWLNVDDDLAGVAVKTHIFAGESDLLGDSSSGGLEINLIGSDADLSEENNLLNKRIM